MNSYKKLINNSMIFAIGRLGSKVISIILLPLYTYYLSTDEYGMIDLITVTVTMLLPIVAAAMYDATLRFIIEDKKRATSVLSNAISVALIGFAISIVFFPLVIWMNLMGNIQNSILMYILLFVQIIERIFAEFTRAIGEVKKFAINGILLTFSTGLLNIIFLVVFKWGLIGYLVSLIMSFVISIIYLLHSIKIYKFIKISYVKMSISKQLLKYSIPLIPNSFMWWLINASSRYFIRFFVGMHGNGLFAIASRIPSLINIVNDIFIQAWQLSAIEEYENKSKSVFYSNVFSYLSTFLFLGVSGILIILKPTFRTIFSLDYYEAWKIVPFLLLGAVFSSFSGFLGTNYIAAKQTSGVLKTSGIGGVLSLIVNVIFISKMGIEGAGISSMISFLTMWLLRYHDTKKMIEIKMNWLIISLDLLIISLQVIILWLNLQTSIEILLTSILFFILVVINWKAIKNIFKVFFTMKNRK